MKPVRWALGCVLLALLAALPACAKKDPHRKPVFPVSGRLVFHGEPAEKALVMFHRLDHSEPHPLRPLGKVLADGSFRVSTYVANDGAPPGEYVLTVIWPQLPKDAPPDLEEGPDRLQGRCNNPQTSPWRVRVEEKDNDVGTLDLQTWRSPQAPERTGR